MRERLASLPPEQREAMVQRMRARGFDPTSAQADDRGPRVDPSAPRRLAQDSPPATTIDALFGPLPATESQGRVWRYVDNQLRPVRVRLGITDGQTTELIEGDLAVGVEVVTNVATSAQTTRPAAGGGIPTFLGGRPPGGLGNRGGGGGRGF